jgi:hypothetical protein
MNTIKINYNYDTDKTKIKFNDEFNSLPMIHQLDAMKDGLCLLEERYNTLLHNFNEQLLTREEVNQGADMNDIEKRG